MYIHHLFPLCIFILHIIAPTGVPANITSTKYPDITVNVTWAPPPNDKQNGVIKSYNIKVTDVQLNETNYNTSNTTWILLQNLHPYYNYSVSIAAATIDVGPYSSEYYFTAPEAGNSLP